ncbi:sulfite exporter TauE/SafE family protein [Alkalibacterium sp. f15]|uniref:sulfite exporter TauE/SafE family protein n=1 Tax=Alkalibacterium sp. f15 TaxID=3414029 RepID=UPI003BF80ECA
MDSSIIILVIGAVFLGSLMRSTFGFGDSVVSMPLLALLPIPFSTTVSLVALVGCTVAIISIFSGWKNLDRTILLKLSVSTIFGIPFGLLLVNYAEKKWISLILGILLVSYSVYSVLGSKRRQLTIQTEFTNTNYGLPFGFSAGMLGSAYNMNGIPIVLYGTMSNWSPSKFKDTLQAHFLLSSLLIVISHFLSGFWTRELGVYFVLSLPAVLLAIFTGNYLYTRIKTEKFKKIVLLSIFLLGVFTLIDFF